ncbi:MAG TPA: T9SS type A sorting domain-containing protein [Bacteroidota bacterium]
MNEKRTVYFSRFENNIWLPPDSIEGTTTDKLTQNSLDYGYDVDLDTTGTMWLGRLSDSGATLFKRQLDPSFSSYAFLPLTANLGHPLIYFPEYSGLYPVFPSDPITRQYRPISIVAIDSQRIWIDYGADATIFFYFQVDNFEPAEGNIFSISEVQSAPILGIKTPKSNVQFLQGGWEDHHGSTALPFAVLIGFTPTNSLIFYGVSGLSETATAGIAQDSLMYIFYWMAVPPVTPFTPEKNFVSFLDVIDADSRALITRYSALNFFPRTASKTGSFLATGWIENNQIMLKGIDGFQFLQTTTVPENDLMADTARKDLYIIADTYPNVWIAWRGMLNGQYEIFVMKTQISIEADTAVIVSVPGSIDATSPYSFALEQNYPNPFNPSTTIGYTIHDDGWVNLTVYDVLGRAVLALVDEQKSRGAYSVALNASNLPSGMYFYKLTSGVYSATKKLVLLK